MKFRVIVAGLLVAASAAPAKAQCGAVQLAAQDGCQKAIDLLNFMTPQLSTALVGGNPTLGQGGTLGGLGHFSLDIRASAVNGQLPQFNNVGLNVTGAQASTFPSKQQYIPFPSVDAGVGLWRGWSLGVTHVGGVDALVTMTYVPNMKNSSNSSQTNFTVNGSNQKFGYGVRLGLLEESAVTPGVSVAWVQRDMPSLSVNGAVQASGSNPAGTLALNDFTVKTTAWRVTAAKSFLIFGLSAGAGQDKYDASSSITATVTAPGNPTGTVNNSLTMTRMNYHVGAYMNLFVFKLEAEYGQVTGGTLATPVNNYGADPATSRNYFTVGLRFGR
jgi:hypothetical protein